jgi:NAD(P)-dependent dehydrogenase (short-subunit alcohol dehydrogenase family)
VQLDVTAAMTTTAIRVTQAALPSLRKSENPVVVNVLEQPRLVLDGDQPRAPSHNSVFVYGASKAVLTVQYAKAVPKIKFNAIEPGITASLGGERPSRREQGR